MASLYPCHFSAVQVGAYFLEHYYGILQQQPELVHQFYTEGSSMVRVDGTATESATGMVQIHHLVMCLNFKGIEIKSAHSLESLNGGVLVMVSGYVQLEDYSIRRKFVQTFFLAPQEKGYYILNDMFHFLEEEHIFEHPATLVSQTDFGTKLNMSSPVPEAVPDYILQDEVQAQDLLSLVQAEENDTVENYSIPEAPQQLPVLDERLGESFAEETVPYPIALETTRDPPPATAEEPVGEPTKHTYASILRAKGQSGPSMHPSPVVKTSLVGSEQAHSFSQQSHPAIFPENTGSEAIEEALVVEDEVDSRSVYVGNLPSSISTSDLEQVFKNFGKLRPDGVFIRSRKESDVFYAFIEYQDAIGVQNALKASPIQLNGRLIHVEGRRPNSGVSRGRRGRGRGYPSEASGGRVGGRTFGRGIRQDSNDKDYISRARGSGYAQPIQERDY
ncbi:nuclear transport factor 2-like isoform X1 [Zingiber officinale]|uniref:nuclear transport factor 2-like isoform X1 n=1 Tax=Zingiber officinale TaxID=94328 RepID=UPI001C4C050D|nr:nuclear transport factor 2-like isoform X1 [Zingiber officinale]